MRTLWRRWEHDERFPQDASLMMMMMKRGWLRMRSWVGINYTMLLGAFPGCWWYSWLLWTSEGGNCINSLLPIKYRHIHKALNCLVHYNISQRTKEIHFTTRKLSSDQKLIHNYTWEQKYNQLSACDVRPPVSWSSMWTGGWMATVTSGQPRCKG